MSEQFYSMVSTAGLAGESYNRKDCFEARDIFFQCLDDQKSTKPSIYKCQNTYDSWNSVCNPSWRNGQMQERRRIENDHFLYTQKRLDDYNKRKNQEGKDRWVYSKLGY